MFGAQPSSPAFGTPATTPAFGTLSAFENLSSSPAFGTPSPSPFATGFGFGSSLFSTPFSSQPSQQQSPLFLQPAATGFSFLTPSAAPAATGFSFQTQSVAPAATGFSFLTPSVVPAATGFSILTPSAVPAATGFCFQTQSAVPAATGFRFLTPSAAPAATGFSFWTPSAAPATSGFSFQIPSAAPQSSPFPNAQLTTQMAPVEPLPSSLSDRDIQEIVEAYKDDPGNPKYAFKHLLFSVTDPPCRTKPAGVSDITRAEAMEKLEDMEKAVRERLKDLSHRLKIQDEVILSDAERLRMIQSGVKTLQRYFLVDTLPRVQRFKMKEQDLQRRLLRVMRTVEALESKRCLVPVMKEEAELADKLALITRQLKGSGEELSRRVQNLLTTTRGQANGSRLQGSEKIHWQSLVDMQEKQTEAIARLGNVFKRDVRDTKIIMAEDKEMTDDAS